MKEIFEKRESKKASDIEMAQFLIKHIKNPCKDLQGNDLRVFYIKEAKRIMDTFQDPDAKNPLENTIQKYSK